MSPTIKVVKRGIKGWFSADFDEGTIATEIQEQEDLGWQLVSSFGVVATGFIGGSRTDAFVFIYRRK